jgi:hypothetical protein
MRIAIEATKIFERATFAYRTQGPYRRSVGVNGSGQITPPSSVGRNCCKLYLSGNQSINSGSVVALSFNSEDYDVGNLHDNAVSNSRIVIPSGGNTGIWFFTACIEWQGTSFAGDRIISIARNGVVISTTRVPSSVGGPTVIQAYAMWLAPAVSDYFEVIAQQTSGVAVNAVGGSSSNTHFECIHQW